jgi:small subunit ribosomal protein S1
MTTPDTETPTSSPAEASTAAAPAGEGQAEPQVSSPTTGEAPAASASPEAPAAEAPAAEATPDAPAPETSASEAGGDAEAQASEGEGKGEGEGKKRRRKKKKHGAEGATEGEEPREARGKPDKAPHAPPPRAAFRIGEEVFGRVKEVKPHALIIDIPGKGDAIFDTSEFDADGTPPSVGDRFVAKVLGDGGRGGLVVLARKHFDDPTYEDKVKEEVEKAFNEKAVVLGLVTGAIKGGLEVYVKGLRAFAPASHVDLRPGSNLSSHIGQQHIFLVEQYAKKGRDVVLSRRAFLEEESKKQRDGSLAKLTVGAVVPGVVRSIVEWGVFVAIPEADDIEGLVHATEVSHEPRVRLRDAVKIGETIQVKVVKIDDKGKLWLSKKAAEPDPWEQIRSKYAVGSRHKGKVTRNKDFGSFVELEPGLEGLIHLADLSLKRVESPSDVVKEGQEIDVVIAAFDSTNKKIGLHPSPPGSENEPRQRVAPHKTVKVAIVSHEPAGLIVRILGATGRHARGFIPAGHTGTPRGTDLRKQFPAGSEHEVKVIEVDPKRGEAKLSIKALREDTEKAAYNEYRQNLAKEAKFGTLADLLKKSQG